MSSKAQSPKKSSEWRRMSDRVNILKASSKSNDCPADVNLLSRSLEQDFQPVIECIQGFRILNGVEQYLVSWKYQESSDPKSSWEVEKVLEVFCKEVLIKYWLKCLLTSVVSYPEKELDDAPPKQFYTKKLWNWATQPPATPSATKAVLDGIDNTVQSSYFTPPKKRPRRTSFDDEDSNYGCRLTRGSEKKPRVFHLQDFENGHSPRKTPISPLPPKLEVYDEAIVRQYSDRIQNSFGVVKYEEITHLIDTPHYEIGEVIVDKKLTDSQLKNSYLVTWFYVSYETAETLGLKDDMLQMHFSVEAASSSSDNTRFQLQRKKYGKAIIRSLPNFNQASDSNKKSPSSVGSDSDLSDASTHPLSEISSGPKEADFDEQDGDVEEQKVEVACQTGIELDPSVCQYCQSKKGERSSQRKKKGNTKDYEDCSSKKSETQLVSTSAEEQANENDDDLVDIEYEVEHIVNYQKVEGTNADQYYVKWKGFTSQYNTWEPYSNLCNCDKVLITFYANRMADRRQLEHDHLKNLAQKENGNGTVVTTTKKPLILPPLPPVPEPVLEMLCKKAPITDAEVEMAFKISRTVKKSSRWPKKKLRKYLLDLIGVPSSSGTSGQPVSASIAPSELPILRHQILMLEAERRKELRLKDLKQWETHLNWITQGRPEIIVENNYDLAGPPVDFKYINDNVIGEGVNFPDDTLEGCVCEDTCVKKDTARCCPGKHGKVLAYNIFKRLRVPPGYPIYECNKRCKCGPECANRVVQDGTVSLIGTKLCIFRTSNERGWGVKTLKKIKRGTFVCLYAGEIITTEEAESRGQVYENQLGACYLFDLDYYAGEDEEESCPYTIDATKMGNISHFINHSCDPNLCVFNVWADCVDQNLPKLAFFALREINKDEELTYDYGSQDADQTTSSSIIPSTSAASLAAPSLLDNGEVDPEDDMGYEIDPEMLSASSPAKNRLKLATNSAVRKPCLCGSSNCRKVLF